MEEAWINRYQKQLVRSISPQFLEEIICYLRRLDLLTAEEAGRVQEASSLPEQNRWCRNIWRASKATMGMAWRRVLSSTSRTCCWWKA